MSAWVELFDSRRAEVTLALGDGRAWVRTTSGPELVDLADVAPVETPIPVRRCGVAKPKAPRLPQLPKPAQVVQSNPTVALPPSLFIDQWPVRTNLRGTFRGPGIELDTPNGVACRDAWRRARRPPSLAGGHPHYWRLDAQSIGTCTICGQVKDFREKLLDLDPRNPSHRRPRKEAKSA